MSHTSQDASLGTRHDSLRLLRSLMPGVCRALIRLLLSFRGGAFFLRGEKFMIAEEYIRVRVAKATQAQTAAEAIDICQDIKKELKEFQDSHQFSQGMVLKYFKILKIILMKWAIQ